MSMNRNRARRVLVTVATTAMVPFVSGAIPWSAPAASAATPPPEYVFTDLGTTGANAALGLNDLGDVVGGMSNGDGFHYRIDSGVARDLGPGTAWSVSDNGTVFGWGHGASAGGTAFSVTPDGQQGVGTRPEPQAGGLAWPATWSSREGWSSLYGSGCRLPNMISGAAYAVNRSGQLVGQEVRDDNGNLETGDDTFGVAFECGPDPAHPGSYTATDLAPYGGALSGAFAINAAGQVAGKADTSNGVIQAYRWTVGVLTIGVPLGYYAAGHAPADGFSQSAGYGINDAGDVVGAYGQTATVPNLMVDSVGDHAFVWRDADRVMRDLNDLVGPLNGWTLNIAFDVNNRGQIVGQGTLNGQKRAFLLTPVSDVNITADRVVVTQTIQNEENLDTLIARKQTYAIVRAHSDTRDVPNVAATLRGTRNGSDLGEISPTNGLITVRQHPRVGDTSQSFVFALPPSWTAGGSLTLTAKVNNDFKTPETNYNDNQTPATRVGFQDAPIVKIVVLDLNYVGQPAIPNPVAYNKLRKLAGRLFPVPALDIHEQAGVATIPEPEPIDGDDGSKKCGRVLTDLSAIRAAMNLDNETLLFGQLPLMPDGSSPYGPVVAGCSWVPSLVATGWTGALADFIAAHELTHAIGRNHIPFCGAKGSDVPGYPSPASMGRIYAGSIHQAAFTSPDDFDLGFDGSNFLPANSAVDLMTYCNSVPQWISDYTYEGLFREIPLIGTRAAASLQPGTQALHVQGVIDLRDQSTSVSLNYGPLESVPPAPSPGPYHITFYDAATKLSDTRFTPSVMGPHDTSADEVPLASIDETVAVPAGADRMAVYSDEAGEEISSTVIGGSAPTVSVASPQSGQQLAASGSMTVTWSARDPDGNPLRHTVLYRPNANNAWNVLASDITASSAAMDLATLPGSQNGTLRVETNDGFFTSHDDVTGLVVPGKAPSVTIDTPEDKQVVTAAQPVLMSGSADTVEGVSLDDSAFAWDDDKDGNLGSGRSLLVNSLSVGQHHVRLRVTAPSGQVGSATVTVVVGAAGAGPDKLVVSNDAIGFVTNGTTEPAPETISLSNPAGAALGWTATSDDPRITLSAASGVTPADIQVSADTSALRAGDDLLAHVTIKRNDGLQDPVVVSVSAQSAAPVGGLSPRNIDFGRQDQATASAPHDVTFTYNAAGQMTLRQASLAGPAPADYAISSDQCSNKTLSSGASCTLSVGFDPGTAGRRAAYLVLSDANSTARWYVSLTGLAFRQIAAPSGTLLAWGDNSYGEAGTSPSTPPCSGCVAVPSAVSGISDVAAAASGGVQGVAATKDGRGWAWGQNCAGTLGDGASDCPNAHPAPQVVPGLSGVTDVAAGPDFSLALRRDRTVAAWGSNSNGAGFPSGVADGCSGVRLRVSPVTVTGPGCAGSLSGVVAIAAGGDVDGNSTSYALKSDGTVWQWGSRGPGSNNNTVSIGPVQVVASGGTPLTGIVAIAHGMALRNDGTVWTWGYGADGQLGGGQSPTVRAQAAQVLATDASGPLTGVSAIASYQNERYALKSDGRVLAWGSGRAANRPDLDGGIALGIGGSHPTGVSLPTPVLAPGGAGPMTGARDIAAGLAVLSDNTVAAWGRGILGGLGDGTYIFNPWTIDDQGPTSPVAVKGPGGQGLLANVARLVGGETRFALAAGGPVSALSAGPARSVSGTQGNAIDDVIGTFNDASSSEDASAFSASVDWGDGSTTSATAVTGAAGAPFDVHGSHVYAQPGEYQLTIVVATRSGDSITLSGSVTVANAPLTAVSTSDVGFTAGAPLTPGVARFRDGDPASEASDFSSTIDWGDGTAATSATVVGPPGGPFTLSGSHTYARAGTYSLVVNVTQSDGSHVVLQNQAVVAPASLAPADSFGTPAAAGRSVSGPLASFTDGNPVSVVADYSAVVDWGDGSQSSGTVSGPNGGPYTVSGSHTYAATNTYVVSVTLRGPAGASATAYTTLLSPKEAISVTSAVDTTTAAIPFDATFTYVVSNDGDNPAVNVRAAGSLCGAAAFTGGDNGNGLLDQGEKWTFTCTHHFDTAGTFTDGGSATAQGARDGIPLGATSPSNPITATAWPFAGFFAPVDNPPVINVLNAGSAVPVRFSLGGDRGLDIFAAGFPASGMTSCTGPTDVLEEVADPGSSTLTYDSTSGLYQFNWKTSKSWKGTCRQLILRFVTGSQQTALFQFK